MQQLELELNMHRVQCSINLDQAVHDWLVDTCPENMAFSRHIEALLIEVANYKLAQQEVQE